MNWMSFEEKVVFVFFVSWGTAIAANILGVNNLILPLRIKPLKFVFWFTFLFTFINT